MNAHLWDVKDQLGRVIDQVVAQTEEEAHKLITAAYPGVRFTLKLVK